MKRKLILRWCRLSALAALAAANTGLGWAAQEPEKVNTNALTLDDAIRLVLASNPELRASGARVDAASGRAYQAKKWTNPELELSMEDWPVRKRRGFSDAKQTIGISQTLPYPGKKALDRQVGGAGVKLSEAELALRRTEIERDVKAGFFRVKASEQLAAVASELVEVAESSAATARKRVDAGAAPLQEQLRAEVQLEQARTVLSGFQRELAGARQVFAALLGRPDLKDTELTGALTETPDANLMADAGTAALENHPSAAVAQAILDRAQLELRRARLEPYPDVKLGLAGGRIGETDEAIIQLGISLPLPLIDRGKGRQQEARANVDVAEAEWRGVLRQLRREQATAQQRYRTAVEQAQNYRENILPKAVEALRLVQIGFEQGKFNFIDLVDTQRTTAEARLAYQKKLLEMNVAHAELEALLKPQANQPVTTK